MKKFSSLLLVAAALACSSTPEQTAPAEPAALADEIEGLSVQTNGEELRRVSERALVEGTTAEQGDAVAKLAQIARQMRTSDYQHRLSREAEAALRDNEANPSRGRIEQTMTHNRKLRQTAVVDALGVFASSRIDAAGQLLWIAEQRWDADVREAALSKLEGHMPPSQAQRVAAIGANRAIPAPVRIAALRRVSEVGTERALDRLWPVVEGNDDDVAIRTAAMEAVVAGGAADELFERLPAEGDYPPAMIGAVVERLITAQPPVNDEVLTQLEARCWPCRVIALSYLERSGASDAVERARELRRDRARLQPASAWAEHDGCVTVGDVARRIVGE